MSYPTICPLTAAIANISKAWRVTNIAAARNTVSHIPTSHWSAGSRFTGLQVYRFTISILGIVVIFTEMLMALRCLPLSGTL